MTPLVLARKMLSESVYDILRAQVSVLRGADAKG